MVTDDGRAPGRAGLARADLDHLVAAYQQASRWRRDAAELVGEGRGRLVIATVDATGVLVDLDVPDAACTRDGRLLAEDVVRAVTAARHDVTTRLVQSGERTFGPEAPQLATIRDAAQARSEAPIRIDTAEADRSADGATGHAAPRRQPDTPGGSFGQW
jgi:hypothetical protein